MRIAELFDKEIERNVNPAVTASSLDKETTLQEIEEYIFTPDITKSIYKFLKPLLSDHKGKTGVWINGYYGSGKSHFIKYLYYCLNITEYPVAFDRFEQSREALDPLDAPTPADVQYVKGRLKDMTFELDLFNIDTVSGQGTSEKDRITRIFINRLNALRGYNSDNIALAILLEKELDRLGLFSTFKSKILSEYRMEWSGNEYTFCESYLEGILDIAQELNPKFDTKSLRNAIEKDEDFNIDRLISELNEYIRTKEPAYRLIFLIDEVSQYIGSNSQLLLNLQTIVERIGDDCDSKVWVLCTAQQELQDLVTNTDDSGDGFGKILGRFDTKISLSSTDAAFITKKRILDKKAAGIGELSSFYEGNKVAIENQFVFENALFKNYEGKDDFILTYPFVPYQFTLISDVFQGFNNLGFVQEGVKNTERAILGITHFTAKQTKDQEVSYFVPFDLFYGGQLKENLTFRATQMISRAHQLPEVAQDPFAQRVVNTLFMIANLSDSSSVAFPANADNIALLLLDDLNSSKGDYIKRVQPILDMLEKSHIIQLNEGKYRFLSDDEIEVAALIKNTSINLDDRLDRIYDDFIKVILNPSASVTSGGRNLRVQLKLDDKEFSPRNDFELIFSFYNQKELTQRALDVNTSTLVICLSEILSGKDDLRNLITEYTKTAKFIKLNVSKAEGPRVRTITAFKDYNITRGQQIKRDILDALQQAPIISAQQVVTADQFSSREPKKRYQEIIDYHLQTLYRKSDLVASYAHTRDALIRSVLSPRLPGGLTDAEIELESKIANSSMDSLSDLLSAFSKAPYGWKDIATMDVLVQLAHKKKRSFELSNSPISIKEFAEKAPTSSYAKLITVVETEDIDVKQYIDVFNDTFPDNRIATGYTDQHEFQRAVQQALKPMLESVNAQRHEYPSETFSPILHQYHGLLSEWYTAANPQILLKKISDLAAQIEPLRDQVAQITDFVAAHMSKYQAIRDFIRKEKHNLSGMYEVDQDQLKEVIEYTVSDHEPWQRFAQMRKAHKELHQLLSTKVTEEQSSVVAEVQAAYHRLETKSKELGTAVPNVFVEFAEGVKEVADLSNLKALRHEISNKEVSAIQKMEPQKKIATMDFRSFNAQRTISTQEGIDKYLSELKSKMSELLAQNDRIVLK